MVKRFRTASTRVSAEEWEKYQELCAEKGLSPHADLKNHIEELLNVGTVRKVDTAVSEQPKEPRESIKSDSTSTKRTITINGQTYTY